MERFKVIYHEDEEGRIVALCPTLRGCYAEGETQDEAWADIREVILAHVKRRRPGR